MGKEGEERAICLEQKSWMWPLSGQCSGFFCHPVALILVTVIVVIADMLIWLQEKGGLLDWFVVAGSQGPL